MPSEENTNLGWMDTNFFVGDPPPPPPPINNSGHTADVLQAVSEDTRFE